MKKWLKDEDDKLVSLLKDGKTYPQMCECLKVSDGVLRTRLRKLKISKKSFNIQTKQCLFCCDNFEFDVNNKHGRLRKYCNHTCAAYATNERLGRNINTNDRGTSKCKVCDVNIGINSTFCGNTCYARQNELDKFKLIESGDTTLIPKYYKKYLIEKNGDKCMECSWCSINETTGNIPIQLEHIDGNSTNNSLGNLKLLCPNCHSLTSTYGSLNNGNGRSERQMYRKQLKNLTLDELIEEKGKLMRE